MISWWIFLQEFWENLDEMFPCATRSEWVTHNLMVVKNLPVFKGLKNSHVNIPISKWPAKEGKGSR